MDVIINLKLAALFINYCKLASQISQNREVPLSTLSSHFIVFKMAWVT